MSQRPQDRHKSQTKHKSQVKQTPHKLQAKQKPCKTHKIKSHKNSQNIPELIRKSIGAALLIALGDYALLKLGTPIGPIIFSLGLLGVCFMGQNLFTGKCGFLFADKIPLTNLLLILLTNLIAGYLIGLVFSTMDGEISTNAIAKVESWSFSFPFFLKAIVCGIIMYIAVYLYKRGTTLGILFGIPLFIFCGFQHCIANVITMGAATTFDWSLLLAIAGNFLGSIFMWWLTK